MDSCGTKVAAALACCLTTAVAAVEPASFQGLGALPGDGQSSALGVSNDGSVVVGYSSNLPDRVEAFRWEGGVITALGDLPGGAFRSSAHGISGDGRVVVGSSETAAGTEAFRWEDGTMVSLGVFSGGDHFSQALAASDDGSIVVGEGIRNGIREACVWQSGQMTGLGLLSAERPTYATAVSSDGGVIVGVGWRDLEDDAVQWIDGQIHALDLQDQSQSRAYGVSRDGSVVVGFYRFTAAQWDDGILTVLDELPGTLVSQAHAASGDGSTLVGYCQGAGWQEAFIWTEEAGTRSIKDVLVHAHGLNLTGWDLQIAWDVSEDGKTIVGEGVNPQGQTEAWMARLGEPGGEEIPTLDRAWLTVLCGLLLLFATVLVHRRAAGKPLAS